MIASTYVSPTDVRASCLVRDAAKLRLQEFLMKESRSAGRQSRRETKDQVGCTKGNWCAATSPAENFDDIVLCFQLSTRVCNYVKEMNTNVDY